MRSSTNGTFRLSIWNRRAVARIGPGYMRATCAWVAAHAMEFLEQIARQTWPVVDRLDEDMLAIGGAVVRPVRR